MTTQVTSKVKRKHGSMPEWCVLGVGISEDGRPALYWPWWSDINGERFLTRFIVFRSPLATCEITRIHMDDTSRPDPHDHSHSFLSWKAGWYSEWVYYDKGDLSDRRHIRHRRFGMHRLRYTRAHSITEVSPGLITVLLAWRRRQKSSYWTPDGLQDTGVNGSQGEWA